MYYFLEQQQDDGSFALNNYLCMKKHTINIYGSINSWGDNSAAEFTRRLNEAAKDADEIELHIHCYGGEVFEGNMIYNAIKSCKKPVDVYIDGIAASMGCVIALAGRKIYMAENAFMMVHAPSGCVCGTASEMEQSASLLRAMERGFINVLSKRTGKKETDVNKWLEGDNWFDANEAVAENLIDGIVEIVQDEIIPPAANLKSMNSAALHKYAAELDTIKPINSNKNNKEMDKKSLIDKFGLTGVTAESTDAEIEAAIEAKISAPKQELETAKKSQITAAINTAIAAKKVSEKQRAMLECIGENQGIEALNGFIENMPAPQTITSQLKGNNPPVGQSCDDWTWSDWQEKNPRGLEDLREKDPEKFDALYNAHYGVNKKSK